MYYLLVFFVLHNFTISSLILLFIIDFFYDVCLFFCALVSFGFVFGL